MKQSIAEHKATLAGLKSCLVADRLWVLRASEKLIKSESDYKDYEIQILKAEGQGKLAFERE